ncbi:membrane protein insertion efficiency factor YidD [Desulfobotulus mexicanus]|uniref:Membrane protein insertion efficiency factor YidD n=1 Tax=Desulfobotulus mexicanus TaxID=2586642 RepID=A0A5S5MCQ8_9BACT|nr:membrane protein insertion efficiency factor YidD [Desulfobotulus mexicanus]TYT73439.1 membrane protein insertion efficiency factor YidD [Desulfobotulus mexicanus]
MVLYPKRFAWSGVPYLCFVFFLLSGCAAGGSGLSEEKLSLNPMLVLYQGPLDHLHAVRSGRCGMQPTCSSYAAQTFGRKSFLDAWFSVFDRLLRCGKDLDHPNIRWIPASEGPRVFDPAG